MPEATSFEAFQARARQAGFDEVLEKRWDPDAALDTHTHAFDVSLRVAQGEFWLTCGGARHHLKAGDEFALAAGVPHDERYGPEGTTVWVARRHAAA